MCLVLSDVIYFLKIWVCEDLKVEWKKFKTILDEIDNVCQFLMNWFQPATIPQKESDVMAFADEIILPH